MNKRMEKSYSAFLLKLVLCFILAWQLQVNAPARPYVSAMHAAREAAELNQPGQAMLALQAALEFTPRQPATWLELAASSRAAGDLQAAITAYETASRLRPLNSLHKAELANLYLQTGDTRSASELLAELTQDPQPDARIFASLVALQKQDGDMDQAKATLMEWVAAYPSDASALYQLGILTSLDDPGLAITSLARAAEAGPQYLSAYDTLKPVLANLDGENPAYRLVMAGRALGVVNEWEMAARAFQLAVEIEPDYPEALAFLSEALFQTGSDGTELIEKALKSNPDSVIANAIHAMQQRRLGNPDIALGALYRAARQEPDQGIWQLEIASTLVEMDAVAEAYPHFKQAVLLDPQNVQFWKALAGYCAATGIHLRDEGLPAARKVMLLAPEDPASYDTMGRVLAALDDMENAVRYYQKAITMDPALASAHLHLAQVYLNKGKPQLALEHLALAQSYAFQDPETLQTATRLMERYFGQP